MMIKKNSILELKIPN